MDSYDILVIILSITLAIFLVLAIIATSIAIRVLKKVDIAAEHVEVTTANIAEISDAIKSVSGPVAMLKLLAQLVRK